MLTEDTKIVCPCYDKENICDCPYHPLEGFWLHDFICPPAEKIKENLIDAYIEKDQERRHEKNKA